jgi:parallel beta-helix repeat protein
MAARRSLVAALAAALAAHPGAARAQTCGATVTGSVVLAADLACPTGMGLVLASGATLDCAGHAIVGGDQVGQYGVYLRDAAGAVVRNCVVEHFEVGIRLRGATDCTVDASTVGHNTRYGIEITQGSLRGVVSGTRVLANGDEGIHVSGPIGADGGNRISGNTVDGNVKEGVYLLTSDGNTIDGNAIRNQGTAGIRLKDSDRNTVSSNVLANDPLELVDGAQMNVLTGNTIVGERVRLDGAVANRLSGTSVLGAGGRPSNAYELSASTDNVIEDSSAGAPADYHVSALAGSTGNTFARFSTTPTLRCFVDLASSVAVTDASGRRLACGTRDERLLGKRLLLLDHAAKPQRRKFVALSVDSRIDLGRGDLSDDDPVLAGATLRVLADGGDGFDVSYDLPAAGWRYSGVPGEGLGYRYRDSAGIAGPIGSVVVSVGGVVGVRGKGAGLGHSLATDPQPVTVILWVGRARYCMTFGGTVVFRAGRVLRARDAVEPTLCPP